MKKHHHITRPLIKQLILSACALGMVSPLAMAQQEETDAGRTVQSSPLPSIKNSRNEQRSAQPVLRPARAAAPVRADTAGFAAFVKGVTGQPLQVFGADLFGDVPSTFAPFDGAQANQDYLIGTGDELQIRGWGMVDIDISATVDRSGSIYIPRVGSVKVSGVRYGDLQGYLKKAVGKFFTNFELSASIAQTHSLQVYVVGHAVRPGTYTLGAMSSLLNALFTSGGPNASGSMRNIQLKRAGQTVATFDVYDMLLKGDKSHDLTLRDGDVIYIPEVGPLVALTGNVKRPAIFELKGPATLQDVTSWAGGFDSAASSKQVIVEKSINNSFQSVLDVTVDKDGGSSALAAVPVASTDVLRVFSPGAIAVPSQLQVEYVRVAGEAKQTGVVKLNKGETLRELMSRLGGVTENGYIYATELTRDSIRAAQQAKLDEIADRFERELDSAATQRLSNTTDKENASKVAMEAEQQRRIVQKLRTVKATGRIVLELQDSEAQIKNLPDVPLRDGDSVYIPRRPSTVDVLGSVFQQNTFVYRPKRTVSNYVDLAGGVTDGADKSEMYVVRADGTAQSGRNIGWFSGLGGAALNPGDTVVVPEKIVRGSFMQDLKEWTAIFYQFGLGAAGLKVLKD
ncbi:SLBB domain-containing protein [Janthinobacterium sp.]|uniref:SLBB domain-containing protein n=1 Tax=Janthinobacterium sp. TaxID=1871054 RepID=UPI0025C68F97|nr:SLBB domain-containing protein [Janthinobacterium sp.]NBV15232.1 capsule biosynthesis protein [Janthinobacterium sp.]